MNEKKEEENGLTRKFLNPEALISMNMGLHAINAYNSIWVSFIIDITF